MEREFKSRPESEALLAKEGFYQFTEITQSMFFDTSQPEASHTQLYWWFEDPNDPSKVELWLTYNSRYSKHDISEHVAYTLGHTDKATYRTGTLILSSYRLMTIDPQGRGLTVKSSNSPEGNDKIDITINQYVQSLL